MVLIGLFHSISLLAGEVQSEKLMPRLLCSCSSLRLESNERCHLSFAGCVWDWDPIPRAYDVSWFHQQQIAHRVVGCCWYLWYFQPWPLPYRPNQQRPAQQHAVALLRPLGPAPGIIGLSRTRRSYTAHFHSPLVSFPISTLPHSWANRAAASAAWTCAWWPQKNSTNNLTYRHTKAPSLTINFTMCIYCSYFYDG